MESLREAKDKRMKKVAVALSVVLAVVLAFEVPSMLKGSGGSSTPTAAAPTGSQSTTPPGTASAAVAPVASTKLPNSDALPRGGKSELYSFSHFTAKDPFVQQVVAVSSSPASGSSSSSNPQSTSIAPTTGTAAAVTHHQASRTLAVRGAARIAVNGRVQIVRVGTSFPSSNPLFRLVSVSSNGVAKIGIASGSYSSGARTISLVTGRTLTLVDTADGIRYQLRLIG
ncbi:MAG TPA: hypothetical protein VKB43_09490 [Gaiellaceae bacterium]|nr:hypothetical protein [Gaiellaceae bacterium]